MVLTRPQKCPAEPGSVPPLCILLPTPLSLPLWAETADPVSLCASLGIQWFCQTSKTVHALLTCTYPRTRILGCDLFQRFVPRLCTPAEISISGSTTLPAAKQIHGCNEHTASVCMLIRYSPIQFSVVDRMKRQNGVCGVTAVIGFAQITGSLENIFCRKNGTI